MIYHKKCCLTKSINQINNCNFLNVINRDVTFTQLNDMELLANAQNTWMYKTTAYPTIHKVSVG